MKLLDRIFSLFILASYAFLFFIVIYGAYQQAIGGI